MRGRAAMIASSRLPEGHSEKIHLHDIPREGRESGVVSCCWSEVASRSLAEVVVKAISPWARLRSQMRTSFPR